MKKIDKMLMECQSSAESLYLAMITIKFDGTVDMLCCFRKNGKESNRHTRNYKDKQEARKELEELAKDYPEDEKLVVLIDDIEEVMQYDPEEEY